MSRDTVSALNVFVVIVATLIVYNALVSLFGEQEATSAAEAVPEDVCACECDGDTLGVLHAWEQGWIVRDPTTGEPVVVR